jgi:hypothetical protein
MTCDNAHWFVMKVSDVHNDFPPLKLKTKKNTLS